jgi:phosphate uptake regulator
MFKNLIQFWKGKDFLSEVMDDFKIMLSDSEYMFKSSYDVLVHNKKEPGLEKQILRIDKKVNGLQKAIRRRIIEHMTIQPSVDSPACLLLFSVSKDAERVGDYAKNLLEVSRLLEKPIEKETYYQLFKDLDKDILDLFKQTRDAFIESNEEKAAKAWDSQKNIKKQCDDIVRTLAKSNYSVNESVCFTLIARFIRRMSSHLTNIATSVIVPLTELDYYYDKNKEEKLI